MATTIKFPDGSTFSAVSVIAGQMYLQSAQRRTLEIHINKEDADFDKLEAASREPATLTINDETCDNVYNNYSLRANFELRLVITAHATDTESEQTHEQYIITLAHLTYIEIQLAALITAKGGTK